MTILPTPSSLGQFSNSIDHLAITGLPERCSRLMPARIYLYISELFDFSRALIRQISTSVRPIVVICQSHPSKFYWQNPAQQQVFEQSMAQGKLRIFQIGKLQNEKSSLKQRLNDIEQAIREVQYFVKAKNALVVIESARQLLGVEDEKLAKRATQAWLQHAHQYGNSLLFLLSGVQSNPMLLHNIRTVQDKIAGFAVMNMADGAGRLTVHHWYSSAGVCAEQQFHLHLDEKGLLQAEPVTQTHVGHLAATAVDSESVWTLMPVVKGEDWPSAWSVSQRFADLDQASDGAVAGTVILPYGRNTEIEVLARQVFMLRKTRGNLLKIIVREVSARMRHAQERLVRYLGATMVVPVEVGFSRLLGIVDSIGDLEFESPLCDDFDQAFIQATPQRKQGYLPPDVFIEHSKELIAQTKSFGIKFAFVRLTVYKATKVQDVLKVCQIRRPGDICSADEQYIYLFLFGCRESDIARALTFIFNISAAHLFESEVRYTTVDETLLAIEAFEMIVDKQGARDHTQWLLKNSNQAKQGADGEGVFNYRQIVVEFNKAPAISASIKPLQVKRT